MYSLIDPMNLRESKKPVVVLYIGMALEFSAF